jgi:hypothetical protein
MRGIIEKIPFLPQIHPNNGEAYSTLATIITTVDGDLNWLESFKSHLAKSLGM